MGQDVRESELHIINFELVVVADGGWRGRSKQDGGEEEQGTWMIRSDNHDSKEATVQIFSKLIIGQIEGKILFFGVWASSLSSGSSSNPMSLFNLNSVSFSMNVCMFFLFQKKKKKKSFINVRGLRTVA